MWLVSGVQDLILLDVAESPEELSVMDPMVRRNFSHSF